MLDRDLHYKRLMNLTQAMKNRDWSARISKRDENFIGNVIERLQFLENEAYKFTQEGQVDAGN